MFLTTATRKTVQNLLHWLQQRLTSSQWQVDRQTITNGRCQGLRPRVLLSRSLCLYYVQDLARIPAARRQQALAQQVRLLSPFDKPGFYARWQGATAQLWVWDQAALAARLPQAANIAVLPDSSLAEPQEQGESWVAGISGVEWQQWQANTLQDSRWVKDSAEANVGSNSFDQQRDQNHIITLDLQAASPLQGADRQQLIHWGLSGVAVILVLSLLLQMGGAFNLWQRQKKMDVALTELNQSGQQHFADRRQAREAQDRWQARQQLSQPAQFMFIQQLADVIPESASNWQRYHFEPGRLQLQLIDPTPDPRDYVRRLSAIPGLSNVQVQPDAASERLQLQVDVDMAAASAALNEAALSSINSSQAKQGEQP